MSRIGNIIGAALLYGMTRVTVRGMERGELVEYAVEVYVGSHKQWGIPARALKTCIPPAIVALMQARGEVTEKGVLPQKAAWGRRLSSAIWPQEGWRSI